jgi:hypothetical protein
MTLLRQGMDRVGLCTSSIWGVSSKQSPENKGTHGQGSNAEERRRCGLRHGRPDPVDCSIEDVRSAIGIRQLELTRVELAKVQARWQGRRA